MSQERKDLIRSFGAEVRLVTPEEDGFLGSIKMTEEWAARTPGGFLPCQFSNENNVNAHYMTTGPEIWAQLQVHGLDPDAFVAGVGTGGTVMGVGKYLKEKSPAVKILARLGLGVGISSGANLIAALMLQEKMGKDAVVVTIFSDDNKNYLSTDLMKEEPVKPGFLSTDVELLGFGSVNRVCDFCMK